MGDEKNEKDVDVSSLDDHEPASVTIEVPSPGVKKGRRRILWIAGVCGVIAIIALVVVVAIVVLKDEASSDGSERQGQASGSGGVTSTTEEWSQWSGCNVSCGVGRRIRVRNLCPPTTTPTTTTCDKEQTRTCRLPTC